MSQVTRAVITGMGVCLPMAQTLDELKSAILAGRTGMIEVDRFDASRFKGRIASTFSVAAPDVTPAVLRPWAERTAGYALHALRQAKAASRIAWTDYAPERIAIVIGTSNSGIERLEEIARAETIAQIDRRKLAATSIAHVTNVVATRVAAKGPRVTFSSACASSTAAVGHAMDLIRDDRADLVIVVGADDVSHGIMAGFNSLSALSASHTAPFSEPIGITLGEGAGVLVIENAALAQRRGAAVIAEVTGYALSGDAYHATSPDRDGRGIESAVRMALADAGLEPSDIDYVSAHGTGTEANDAAESQAMARLFGPDVPVSSSKSFLGHTLGASGIIEMIATLIVAQDGYIPPTVNFKGLRPGCADLDYVPNTPRRQAVRRFACNNYAFGGNNASTIIDLQPGEAPVRAAAVQPVAITGAGVVSALGLGVSRFAEGFIAGQSFQVADADIARPVARVPNFSFSDPRLKVFARTSPMVRFAIEAAHEAKAGLDGEHSAPCGLIMGIVNAAQRNMERFLESVSGATPELASPQHFSMTTMNAIGGQVSIAHGLKGYNTSLAGSLAAAAYGFMLVNRGRQERVIVAGCDEVTPKLLDFYAAMNGLVRSSRAAPFDGKGGFNHGEGAAALMFEGLDAARARNANILALLSSVVETQDPKLAGGRRDGDGLARAVRLCLQRAGLHAGDIGAVVATGSWTAAAQAAELAALRAVFGEETPPVHSVVEQVGLLPAAGALFNIAAAIQLLQHGHPARSPAIAGTSIHKQRGAIGHILVMGSDITGPHAAMIVSRSPDEQG
jgi:3-oxoacyl-[acyl-carrier-protein] synthase II